METKKTLEMSDVGLGNLTEYRLLVLFGNYHSLELVKDKNIMPDGIVDAKNCLLYPAYYMTHLQVPVNHFIETYSLWDKVKISVNVKRFGANILDSQYTFTRDIDEAIEEIPPISMQSNSLFVYDATIDKNVNRTSAIPKADCIAELDKLKKTPDSLRNFKQIRRTGFEEIACIWFENYTFRYPIVVNRDVSINHGVIFAKFTEIMDMCEFEFLCGKNTMGFPNEIASYLHVIDRETYYYCNCFDHDVIECRMKLGIEKCEERHITGQKNETSAYFIHEVFELYNETTRNLLVLAKAKKLVCLPIAAMTIEDDIERIVHLS